MNELYEILNNIQGAYIFGVGQVGRKLWSMSETLGMSDKIIAFLVSDDKIDGNQLLEKPIYSFSDENVDTTNTVLMSVSESYHPDVYEKIKERGFKSIISAIRFFSEDSDALGVVSNEDIERCIDECQTDNLSEGMIKARGEIIKSFLSVRHAFGDGCFYQSFPLLGIKGLRPTDERIRVYGIEKYLSKDTKVLDIGCNIGFIDYTIADRVSYVVGLEYSKGLVETGKLAAKCLGIHNVDIICTDYNKWEKTNGDCFDLIFSFAVHIWIDVTPKEYAVQCYSRLNKGGHIIFESQTMPNDNVFFSFVEEFEKIGLKVVSRGIIKDDKVTERNFFVFEK